MYEGEELTPEVIAKYMQTPEGALELQRIMVEMEQYQGLGDGSQIGASPNIPEDKNRRRMRGVLSGQGLGY